MLVGLLVSVIVRWIEAWSAGMKKELGGGGMREVGIKNLYEDVRL